MPVITLPDGSQRQYDAPVTTMQVATDIGPGLAKATLAGRVGGELRDASDLITEDASLQIITPRDPEGVEIIRHSCAHMLGQAVKQLYPDAQMAIGPVVDNGFYYDIRYDKGFTPEDMERIEQRMAELIGREYDVIKEVTPRDEVLRVFRERGEDYKVQLVEAMPEVKAMALYHHEEYVDMCLGPHVPNTRFCQAFKLTKLAGAYWRADASNEMLQRVYGTAWSDRKQLKQHLHLLAEAEKRDHRRLGKQLDLFHFQDEAPGMVFWHEKGWHLYRAVESYMRERLAQDDYREVHTPQMLDKTLWERSGHWDKFGDMIFATESENRTYAVKPMNCPGHIQVFNQGLKSYRDLPYRMAEFGTVHRNEPSGTLHGLMRARRFTQDDAHIFCTEDQLLAEIDTLINITLETYRHFGFEDVTVALSTRPEKRVGADELWDKAEAALQQALDGRGMEWRLQPGEGAFYGPKIEFTLRDCIGRNWQMGTIQVDFSMPGSLGAEFVANDSSRQVPVMIHRAILGSMERFIGILIEHHAGAMPAWLAPVQVKIMNITDAQADFVREVEKTLRNSGFRVSADLRNEKIGYKIREHTIQKVPYMLVVGDRELESRSVAVRTRSGEDLGSMAVPAFVEWLNEQVAQRGPRSSED